MKVHESEDSVGRMAQDLSEGEAASWGPTGPDGGPMPHLVNQDRRSSARPYSPEHVPCLRDCRHYFEATTHFDAGNYDGALGDYEPVQRQYICKAIPGVFLELSADSPVYECSDWNPLNRLEVQERTYRRDQYWERHPDHRRRIGDDVEIDVDDEDEEDDTDHQETTDNADESADRSK